MKTFNRYFIHFFLISMIIFFIMLSLMIVDDEISVKIWMLLLGLFLVLFYSIPMALFYNNQARNIQINIVNHEESNTIEQLEEIIIKKLNRTVKTTEGNKMTYKSKGKYAQWLTNPVHVMLEGEMIIIILPNGYKKVVMKKFIKQLH